MESVIIYTDGACSGNQFAKNAGGWGAVIASAGKVREISGGECNTTNQRMELKACIKALEAIGITEAPVAVYSDSAYLINCMNQRWYARWLRNGWKNARREPVENRDLWESLLRLIEPLTITFIKVKGHAGVAMNERADELARQAMPPCSGD